MIDNIFSEFHAHFHSLHSGILLHRLPDHQPYFLAIDFPSRKSELKQLKYVCKTDESPGPKSNFKTRSSGELNVAKFD